MICSVTSTLIFVADNSLFLSLSKLERFTCSTETVNDVCDNDVGTIDHVFVTLGDSISPRNILKRRIDRFIVSAHIIFPVKIWQHEHRSNLRVSLL